MKGSRVFGIRWTDLPLVLSALGLTAGAILWLHSRGIALCPFHAVTGLPCPLCGGTRSVVALFTGDPVLSLKYNPLVCIGSVLFPAYVFARLAGERSRRAVDRLSPVLEVALAVAVVMNWVYLICVGR